ncbi:YaiI/YqxD family protein [Aneurinibacillus tyrosinisolvens]|uniref:YaiI/YqxD family protein n=1 Tax=Aneurinibacillus tyrosinisolvens TaxID=1443435 RepID=UPI00069A317B|nr:YaiI/YqxD family protein [Aneurinibacillus tyrosinisolvens]
MKERTKQIWVDADSCPVKDIITQEAARQHFGMNFVASYNHQLSISHPLANVISVDTGFQSVDMYIINHVRAGDLVVTDDYGLACLVLEKGCLALGSRGKEYTKDNISFLLMNRYASQQIAKAGGKRKGPRPLTKEEIDNFRHNLRKVLRSLEGD